MRHLFQKFGIEDLLNLICVAYISVTGLENMNMCISKKDWAARVNEKVCKVGCDRWMEGFSGSEKGQEYLSEKRPGSERSANGSAGACVRLMRNYGNKPFKDKCVCGKFK